MPVGGWKLATELDRLRRDLLAVAQKEKAPVLLVLNRVPPRANLTDAMLFEMKDSFLQSGAPASPRAASATASPSPAPC